MIKLRTAATLLLPLAVSCSQHNAPRPAEASAPAAEEAAVRAVIERYLHGLKFNDVPSLQASFWPEAKLFWVKRDGTLGQLTQAQWYAGFAASAGKEEEGDLRMTSLEVTDDIAAAKITEVYPKDIYVDYVTLARIGGQWRIVAKVYTRSLR